MSGTVSCWRVAFGLHNPASWMRLEGCLPWTVWATILFHQPFLQEWSVSLFSLLHYPFFHPFLNSKPGSITFCLRISWWALKIMVWPGPTKENQPQIFTFTASCFTAGRRALLAVRSDNFSSHTAVWTWQKSSILYRLTPELLSPRCFEKAPISRQSRSRCDCSPFCYIFTIAGDG